MNNKEYLIVIKLLRKNGLCNIADVLANFYNGHAENIYSFTYANNKLLVFIKILTDEKNINFLRRKLRNHLDLEVVKYYCLI